MGATDVLELQGDFVEKRKQELEGIYSRIKEIMDKIPDGKEKDELMFKQTIVYYVETLYDQINLQTSAILELKQMISIVWKETLGDKSFTLPYESKEKSMREKIEEQEKHKQIIEG